MVPNKIFRDCREHLSWVIFSLATLAVSWKRQSRVRKHFDGNYITEMPLFAVIRWRRRAEPTAPTLWLRLRRPSWAGSTLSRPSQEQRARAALDGVRSANGKTQTVIRNAKTATLVVQHMTEVRNRTLCETRMCTTDLFGLVKSGLVAGGEVNF